MAKKRDRTNRRARERALRKEIHKVEKLATLLPGGSPERAIVVDTPPLIAIKVRATPCPQCAGDLEHLETEARSTDAGLLRVARARCRRCHAPRDLWFAIGQTVN